MAKSSAKKVREKAVREGKRNPECNRSPFVFSDMRTRKTKTKKEQLYRYKYKNRHSDESRIDGSFYGLFYLKTASPLKDQLHFSDYSIPIPSICFRASSSPRL